MTAALLYIIILDIYNLFYLIVFTICIFIHTIFSVMRLTASSEKAGRRSTLDDVCLQSALSHLNLFHFFLSPSSMILPDLTFL